MVVRFQAYVDSVHLRATKRGRVKRLCVRIAQSDIGQDNSIVVRIDSLRGATREDIHSLIHFLAEATSPEQVYFDEVRIGKIFPLELLSEVCLKKKGIRCDDFFYHYKFRNTGQCG